MATPVAHDSPVVHAYMELEAASIGLQRALVDCDSPRVAEATRRLAEARAAVLTVTQGPFSLDPEDKGYVRGVAARIGRVNESNLALIRRRIAHLRRLRREFGQAAGVAGYGPDGSGVTAAAPRGSLDELA